MPKRVPDLSKPVQKGPGSKGLYFWGSPKEFLWRARAEGPPTYTGFWGPVFFKMAKFRKIAIPLMIKTAVFSFLQIWQNCEKREKWPFFENGPKSVLV